MCSLHWTRGGTNVLLGRPSRQGDGRLTADRLIPMGVWRDSFAATIRRNGRGNAGCTGLKEKHGRLAPPG